MVSLSHHPADLPGTSRKRYESVFAQACLDLTNDVYLVRVLHAFGTQNPNGVTFKGFWLKLWMLSANIEWPQHNRVACKSPNQVAHTLAYSSSDALGDISLFEWTGFSDIARTFENGSCAWILSNIACVTCCESDATKMVGSASEATADKMQSAISLMSFMNRFLAAGDSKANSPSTESMTYVRTWMAASSLGLSPPKVRSNCLKVWTEGCNSKYFTASMGLTIIL